MKVIKVYFTFLENKILERDRKRERRKILSYYSNNVKGCMGDNLERKFLFFICLFKLVF